MRIFRLFYYFFLLSVMMPLSAYASEEPRDFLVRLYNAYSGDDAKDVYFLGATGQKRIASKGFIAVLEEEQELTLPGDMGYLDHDPLCQCQDYQGLVINNIIIFSNDNKKARAAVTFRAFGDSNIVATTTFNLIAENGRWFIDDIFENDQRSVRGIIDKNNKTIRKERKTF